MLITPGVPTLGPVGSSTPATLADYLTSISKASWYSLFEAGTGMAQNSNGTGAVASGDPVGCWAPSVQVGATFKFIQATSASRPTYSTTQYSQATIYGNGTSHSLATDSTTALNRPITVLVQYELNNSTGMVFAQAGTVWGLRHTGANAPPGFYENGSQIEGQSAGSGDMDQVSSIVYRYRQSGTQGYGRRAIAFNSSDPVRTTRYGNALTLLTGSGLFCAAGIHRIAITDRLTWTEAAFALGYLGA